MTPADLAELRECVNTLGKVGNGIATALTGINTLLMVGGACVERASALLAKLEAEQAK